MRANYDICHTYKNQEREEGREGETEKWAERGGERDCECVFVSVSARVGRRDKLKKKKNKRGVKQQESKKDGMRFGERQRTTKISRATQTDR